MAKTSSHVNRKMNYLSHILEGGLSGNMSSTLFATGQGNEDIDLSLLEAVGNCHTWKVPLDQSAFDQNQSHNIIKATIGEILNFIHQQTQKTRVGSDVLRVCESLWTSLFDLGGKVHLSKVVDRWVNGLPSGWRWTAVLDTILNITSFNVIRRIATLRGGWASEPRIGHHYAQGNDVIFSCPDLRYCKVIADTYNKLGYVVHPLKTCMSRCRAEFLRRSYDG